MKKTGDPRGSVADILGESDRDVHPGFFCVGTCWPAWLIGDEGLGITAVIKTTSKLNDAGRPNESRYRFLGIASFLGDLHVLPPRDQRVFENLHAWAFPAKAVYRQHQIDNEM